MYAVEEEKMGIINRAFMLAAVLLVAFGIFYFGTRFHGKTASARQSPGTATITGPMPGVMFMFDSTGAPLTGYSCALLKGNSTTSGTFSMTATVPTYQGIVQWTNPGSAWLESISIVSPGTAVASANLPLPVSLSVSSGTITLTGAVKTPTTLVVLGATAVAGTTAQAMTAEVCSN